MIYLALLAGIIVFDQLTKWWVVTYLKPMGTLPIIQNVFHFTYAENTGAAFSLFRDRQIFLVLTTFLIIVFASGLLFRAIKTPGDTPWLYTLALTMVIGGAIGNLIDRIRLNYVIDFIDVRLINFAIFNIADSFIVVGTLLVAFLVVFKDLKI